MSPTLLPAAPAPVQRAPRALFGWSVHYVLNFPTGEPIRTVLHYEARSAEEARRCFTYEVNRARLVNSLRCSVLIVEIKPYGAVND